VRPYEIKPSLHKTLVKLCKKDKVTHEIVFTKIEEILSCEDVEHYKNLRYDMKDLKRVHIIGSFVLIFRYDKTRDFVSFENYDHHDNIYKR